MTSRQPSTASITWKEESCHVVRYLTLISSTNSSQSRSGHEAALVVSAGVLDVAATLGRYALIVLLALAMGLQTATARRLGVPGLTTTVLTTTLTGLAADSTLGGGTNPNAARGLLAAASMALGAAVGAFLIFHASVSAILALVVVLLGLIAISSYRLSSSSAAWTAGI